MYEIVIYILTFVRSCISRIPFIGSTINNWMGYRPLETTDDDGNHRTPLRLRSLSRNETRQFLSHFNDQYGSIHPRFFTGDQSVREMASEDVGGDVEMEEMTPSSLSNAATPSAAGSNEDLSTSGIFKQFMQKAKREYRPMLVYLHSNDHENTDTFCTRVLCTDSFRDYVDENFLFFAADVLSQEGMRLSNRLEASTYPFLAVMIVSGSKLEVVARVEGLVDIDTLMSRLISIHDRVDPTLIVQRNEDQHRLEDRLMREEQDRAYEATVERDRLAMEERRRKEEEARLALEAAEKRKHDFMQRLEDIARERDAMYNEIPEEAEKSDKSSSLIRFRFPNGAQIERRFLKTESIDQLYRFVYTLDAESAWTPRPFSDLDKLTLSTNFPKRNLERVETLESSKCFPHAIVFVHEDINEDDEIMFIEYEQQQ